MRILAILVIAAVLGAPANCGAQAAADPYFDLVRTKAASPALDRAARPGDPSLGGAVRVLGTGPSHPFGLTDAVALTLVATTAVVLAVTLSPAIVPALTLGQVAAYAGLTTIFAGGLGLKLAADGDLPSPTRYVSDAIHSMLRYTPKLNTACRTCSPSGPRSYSPAAR